MIKANIDNVIKSEMSLTSQALEILGQHEKNPLRIYEQYQNRYRKEFGSCLNKSFYALARQIRAEYILNEIVKTYVK